MRLLYSQKQHGEAHTDSFLKYGGGGRVPIIDISPPYVNLETTFKYKKEPFISQRLSFNSILYVSHFFIPRIYGS